MELPSIKDELERKSVDMLGYLVDDHIKGKITEAQYSTGLDVLWGVASGLAGNDFLNMMSMTKVDKNDRSFSRDAFLVKEKEWLMVSVKPDLWLVVKHSGGQNSRQHDTIADAVLNFEKFIVNAESQGFVQIN